MVDSERRNAIFKLGAGIGALVGVGYGGLHGATALHDEYEEWEEQRPPRPERWARDVEKDVRDGGVGGGFDWDQTYIAVEDVDVVYQEVGASEQGAPRYRFTAHAPLAGAPFDICHYAGRDMDLALIMELDSMRLYTELFDQLESRLAVNQGSGEPAISSLAVEYTDASGVAGFAFDDGTAEAVEEGGGFSLDSDADRSNFKQPYRTRFAVTCGGMDGG